MPKYLFPLFALLSGGLWSGISIAAGSVAPSVGLIAAPLPGICLVAAAGVAPTDRAFTTPPPVPPQGRKLPHRHLPRPILPGSAGLVALYYHVWEVAWQQAARPAAARLAAPPNAWELAFGTLVNLYGHGVLPALAPLDSGYAHPRRAGYCAPNTPPLGAWVEWRAFQHTADTGRVRRVLPFLVADYQLLIDHWRTPLGGYSPGLALPGTEPAGVPRPGVGAGGSWVDLTAQLALAARAVGLLAQAAGDGPLAARCRDEHDRLTAVLNRWHWNPATAFYHDARSDSTPAPVLHVGGFWPLLAGAADATRAAALTGHLVNPTTFGGPVPVPSLALSDPAYTPRGGPWRGGVYAPTTYMVVAGLRHVGHYQQAHDLAGRYLRAVANAYVQHRRPSNLWGGGSPAEKKNAALPQVDASEWVAPALGLRDSAATLRPAGGATAGLGPIVMLIEDVIGLELSAPRRTIRWHLHEPGRVGLKNLWLGANCVSLVAEPIAANGRRRLLLRARAPFRLVVTAMGAATPQEFQVPKGTTRLWLAAGS